MVAFGGGREGTSGETGLVWKSDARATRAVVGAILAKIDRRRFEKTASSW
jgi:hypothetical protein